MDACEILFLGFGARIFYESAPSWCEVEDTFQIGFSECDVAVTLSENKSETSETVRQCTWPSCLTSFGFEVPDFPLHALDPT